jgi:membrane protein implicated in regulation of membrane protease activity
MTWVVIAYWVCFVTGTTFALVTAIMSGLFGFGHGGIEGGGHFEVSHDYGAQGGGGDVGGHGGAFSVEAQAEAPIAPLSPAVLSVFMATFGGVGIILTTLFHLNLLITLPASAASAFAVAWIVFLVFYHLFTAVQASSEPRMADVIGLSGEVTVPIAAEGMGEIAFVTRGVRLTSPARSQEGMDLGRHEAVKIVRQVGNTLYVARMTEEENAAPPPQVQALDFRD